MEEYVEVGWVLVSLVFGLGIGGAFCKSHFRCIRADFRRSWKIFSPPARKESLILSGVSVVGVGDEREGPGDSGRC
jgi:hypothetical protein